MPGISKVKQFLKYNHIELTDHFVSDIVNDIDLLLGSELFYFFC